MARATLKQCDAGDDAIFDGHRMTGSRDRLLQSITETLDAIVEGGEPLLVPLVKSEPGAPAMGALPEPRYGAVLRSDPRGFRFAHETAWPPGLLRALASMSATLRFHRADHKARGDARMVDARDTEFIAAQSAVEGLRGVVEDGQILVAWVDARGPGRLNARERRFLRALLLPLRRRLLLERGMAHDRTEAALAVALEAMPAPAYAVDWPRREVTGCNAMGRAFLARDRTRVLACIDQRPACPCRCSIVPLGYTNPALRYLVIPRAEPPSCSERVVLATSRWRLTERQSLVLGLLVLGRSNKEVAATLGCAENTVEAHVTQLLAKAGVDQRGGLLFRFWSEI